MPYVLKQEYEAFEVVDGPGKGQSYRHGKRYREVPEAYAARFEQASAGASKKKTRPALRVAGGAVEKIEPQRNAEETEKPAGDKTLTPALSQGGREKKAPGAGGPKGEKGGDGS